MSLASTYGYPVGILADRAPTRPAPHRAAQPATAPLNWAKGAACASEVDLPWTEEPHRLHPADADLMAAICATCPVRTACATYARTTPHLGGTWAAQPAPLHLVNSDGGTQDPLPGLAA